MARTYPSDSQANVLGQLWTRGVGSIGSLQGHANTFASCVKRGWLEKLECWEPSPNRPTVYIGPVYRLTSRGDAAYTNWLNGITEDIEDPDPTVELELDPDALDSSDDLDTEYE